MPTTDAFATLQTQLKDPDNNWSLGTFGAIAEFSRDPDEPAEIATGPGILTVVTPRGGIRLHDHPELRLFASETPTTSGWSHRVSLCLPTGACEMGGRAVLTELGADDEALRPQDRSGVLFDMGLGTRQVDVCVRVADPALLAGLRGCLGRPVFDAGNPAMGFILAASPNRVFVSRVGRAEVYQPIPDPHGRSPEGPHTHVLPRLLAHGRTHAATEPVPDGFVPCAHLYPAHALKDGLGQPLPFDERRHRAFEALLDRFGDPELVTVKRRAAAAVRGGLAPAGIEVPADRFARGAIRVALRQMRASAPEAPALAAWLAAYDHAPFSQRDIDNPEAHHE